jgi:hypothetical protein
MRPLSSVDLHDCRIVIENEMKIVPDMLVNNMNVCIVYNMINHPKSFEMIDFDMFCVEVELNPDPMQLQKCFDLTTE